MTQPRRFEGRPDADRTTSSKDGPPEDPTRPIVPPTVRPRPVPDGADLDHPSLYFNRELGWLDFNRRVLAQALDAGNPLFERVRFLGIAASNLDEFIQKRFGGLRRQEMAGVEKCSPDGRIPSEQLALVRVAIGAMQHDLDELWDEELKPEMDRLAGLRITSYDSLDPRAREGLDRHFQDQVYPVLTPLAVDPGHPFPLISNLSLSLAVELRGPAGDFHFARIKVPTQQGRWVPVPGADEAQRLVPLEDLIRSNVGGLFRGMEVVGCHLFRVIRNADVARFEEEAEDLIAMISEELRERRTAPVVRLEVHDSMPDSVRSLLLRELDLEPIDLIAIRGDLALDDVLELVDQSGPEHRFTPWEPVVPLRLSTEREGEEARPDIFSVIRAGDLLVHHPYDSFAASVQRLVEEAADDPDVLAIKQTLYRTSTDSRVIQALIRAAEKGKQVAVLVEVKARFDEQNNIEWARMLENHEVHIAYGLVGLKTHAKVVLVVRREGGRPRAYCHIGTGNYHADTARIYTDLGLLTCDPAIGQDVMDLFHALTGHAPGQAFRKLLVAPAHLGRAFLSLIRREVEWSRKDGTGRIVAKMNALDDVDLIRELYAASREGVQIDLIVRGHSRLRPGLPGLSENIRVRSIIGRFLEHDRIFHFGNGGRPEVFIGSADWRGRNLHERVEAVTPVTEPELRDRLLGILDAALQDNQLAFELRSDGSYERCTPSEGEARCNLHEHLMQEAREARHPGRGP